MQREMFLNKLEKNKKQYKERKVYSVRTVFKELREKDSKESENRRKIDGSVQAMQEFVKWYEKEK